MPAEGHASRLQNHFNINFFIFFIFVEMFYLRTNSTNWTHLSVTLEREKNSTFSPHPPPRDDPTPREEVIKNNLLT